METGQGVGGFNSEASGLGPGDAGGAHASLWPPKLPLPDSQVCGHKHPPSSKSGVSGEQRSGKQQLGPPATAAPPDR